MSRLRNAASLFSLRATCEKLIPVMDKFKDVSVQVVKSQITKKQLWAAFERVIVQLQLA